MGPRRAGWWCALAASLAGVARAATEPDRAERVPRAAARVVAHYDFEEPGNPLPIPRGWVRGQSDPANAIDRPGFPVWNGAAFDRAAPAASGASSVRLPVAGGSASLRLAPGVVPVFPSADYTVSASVRTDPKMRHARAVLVARQLDDRGNRIPGSEIRTEPIATFGAWRRVAVNVLAESPLAAFLQVELLVLQPEQLADGAPRRPFEVWHEDYDAAAWFDDVLIVQRPRLDLTTGEPGNIVVAPRQPTLHVGVRDLAGEALTVRLSVHDLDGRRLDQRRIEPGGGRLESDWTPRLPAYGWYRAALEVDADGVEIARETCDFLWLAPARDTATPPSIDRLPAGPHRFGVRAGPMPASTRGQIPDIAAALNAGSVSLPVWSLSPEETPADAVGVLTPVAEALHAEMREVTLVLPEMPARAAAAAGVDPADVAGVLRADRSVWSATLDPFFDRFGQRVRRWQIGALASGWQSRDREFARDLGVVSRSLASLVPGPIVSVPWSWQDEPDPALAAGAHAAVIRLDPGLDAEGVDEIVRAWSSMARTGETREPPELALVLGAPRASPHGRAGAADFARRLTGAWVALNRPGADQAQQRLVLDHGWSVRNARRPRVEPTPAAAVWRTLADAFEGRRVVRELDLFDGGRAVLLAPGPDAPRDRGAALVAWREPGPGTGVHDVLLGDGPVRAVDLFGNTRPLEPVAPAPDAPAAHRVELSNEPVIIEGVDPTLVRFLASIRLDPGLVESTQGEHRHDLVFENPWSFPLRGRLFILEPGGHSSRETPTDRSWEVAPRVTDFSAGAGAEGRVPLALSFGTAQRTGERELVIDFMLGGASGRAVRATRAFELGLPGVRLEVYERAGGAAGDDVVLQAEVTNTSDQPITVDLVSVAPGQPKARAAIPVLEPGHTAVRALVFYNARDELGGGEAIVGLSLQDRPGRLNTTVPVARHAAADER